MQSQELMEYISKIIKSVSRFTSLKLEGAIQNSALIFIIDDSLLYHVDLLGKIDSSIVLGFESVPVISQTETGALVTETKLVESQNAYYKVFTKYTLLNQECIAIVFDDPIILEDQIFAEKSAIKASDGCEFYQAKTLNGVITIPIFSGLPLLSKGDKVGLSIYNANIPNQYILRYQVFKKKLNTICSIYYRILNLNR